MADGSESEPRQCDFCRLPCPVDPVTAVHDGVTYTFCSPSCRATMAESDRVFTEYHGHRRFSTGVRGIDVALPEGMPRDSFVLVSGHPGARDDAVRAELIWRTLQRGEPVVVVAFLEPPVSVIGSILKMDWNVLPYLDRGDLHVVDCFTYRRDDGEEGLADVNEWNDHLATALEGSTSTVRDPSDTDELANKLHGVLDDLEMVERGAVVVDSLTELGAILQPVQAYGYVKTTRADVCKGRFVPIFAGAAHGPGENDSFPHDLEYVVDGVLDTYLDGSIVEDTLLKRIRVRKMNGVLAVPEWHAYEYTASLGMVTFDPREGTTAEAGPGDPTSGPSPEGPPSTGGPAPTDSGTDPDASDDGPQN